MTSGQGRRSRSHTFEVHVERIRTLRENALVGRRLARLLARRAAGRVTATEGPGAAPTIRPIDVFRCDWRRSDAAAAAGSRAMRTGVMLIDRWEPIRTSTGVC